MPIKAINYIKFNKLRKAIKITLNIISFNKNLSLGKLDTLKALYNYKYILSIINNNPLEHLFYRVIKYLYYYFSKIRRLSGYKC